MLYIQSVKSEWIKTRRSAASWLCIIGGFFIPLIHLINFIRIQGSINDLGVSIWQLYFTQLWQNMAPFLLPMGIILATSLITQIEYRNNTWKQLHATPQSYTTIFLAKFSVIVLMTLKFFVFFNIGVILSACIPSLIFDHQLPNETLPVIFFLKENTKLFIMCLPLIAVQYLISLQFRNFLVPLGVGLVGLIGSLIGLSWKYIYCVPFSYCAMTLIPLDRGVNVHIAAVIYFLILMLISYFFYVTKKEKG